MRYYSLRFALSPSLNFEKRMNALLDFCHKAKIDDVMFFIGAEDLYEGHITIERAKRYTDLIKRAKEILRSENITVSLNPWCTFSHYDAGRKLGVNQNFSTMVGSDGKKADVVVCPLCKNWQNYYIELLDFYIKTIEPEILWFEDDFRMSNHEPVSNGCFCEEHMKLFNERAGTFYDRETFVKKIFTDKKVRKAYLDVTSDVLCKLLDKICSSLPENQTYGLMTGDAGISEGRNYEKIYGIIGKQNKPYNRLCLHSYRQTGEQAYCWTFNRISMSSRYFSLDMANCVSEIENVPDELYTKSVNYFRAQMLTSIPLCLMGDTFSIFEFNGNGAIEYTRYAKMLSEIKPYLSTFTDLKLSPANMSGVKIMLSRNSAYNYNCNKQSFGFGIQDAWLFSYLEQIGISCTFTTDKYIKNSIVGLSGQILSNFTDEEIIAIFKNNFVIITGENIEILKQRNLLYLINANDFEVYRENQGVQSMEELTTGEILYGVEKLRAIAHYFCGNYYDIDYKNNDKKEYTQLIDYLENRVGAGITTTDNVLIFPYENIDTDQKLPISLICYLREHAIKSAIKDSGYFKNMCFVKEENVCVYSFEKGNTIYVAICNFSDDDYDEVHISHSYNFSSAEILTVDNPVFHDFCNEINGNDITIKEKLNGQSSYVIALRDCNF